MRQATVFLNDYVTQRRIGISFRASDFDLIDEEWEQENERLLSYQHLEPFQGRTRYCDLTTQHLRILIQQVLVHYGKLSDEDRCDHTNPVSSMFNKLALYLVRCIEHATDSCIELLHVNRITEKDISFDFTAVMDMNFAKPQAKKAEPDNPFTIVVDNTK